MSIDKKNILVIGSSGGVGQVVSDYLSMQGFRVLRHYHKKGGVSPDSYQADISKESEVERMVNQIKQQHKKIDGVVHLAGISRSGMSWKTSIEDWEASLKINLTGPFLVSKHVTPLSKE